MIIQSGPTAPSVNRPRPVPPRGGCTSRMYPGAPRGRRRRRAPRPEASARRVPPSSPNTTRTRTTTGRGRRTSSNCRGSRTLQSNSSSDNGTRTTSLTDQWRLTALAHRHPRRDGPDRPTGRVGVRLRVRCHIARWGLARGRRPNRRHRGRAHSASNGRVSDSVANYIS